MCWQWNSSSFLVLRPNCSSFSSFVLHSPNQLDPNQSKTNPKNKRTKTHGKRRRRRKERSIRIRIQNKPTNTHQTQIKNNPRNKPTKTYIKRKRRRRNPQTPAAETTPILSLSQFPQPFIVVVASLVCCLTRFVIFISSLFFVFVFSGLLGLLGKSSL